MDYAMQNSRVLSMIIVLCSLIYTTPSSASSSKIDQKLESTVQTLIDEYKIPGVVIGLWIPNKVEWVVALGVADKKTKEKMSITDHFRIGSLTKLFTVTALLQLSDQGKVSLDDKIGKYIQNVPNGDKITLRQLANMTSGLPSYTENEAWVKEMLKGKNRQWQPQELLDVAFSMPLLAKPGKKFHYCNTNTILLGLVIEKVSGMSLGEYFKKNIFNPLTLSNTSFPLDNKMPEPFAHGYSVQTLTNVEEDVSLNNPSWGFAAGQLISNLEDLKIWAEALGTGELLSKKAFKERLTWLTIPPNTKSKKYGLGIGFNNGWLMHTGELPGYNSIVAYLPEEKGIFVCLVNSDIPIKIKDKDVSPANLIFESIAKIAFPKHTPE
jgi:D-alanyl-D-alanine carboxypeptidase